MTDPKAQLKTLYARMADLHARADGMGPDEAGRAEVYRTEAKEIAKRIMAIKANQQRGDTP